MNCAKAVVGSRENKIEFYKQMDYEITVEAVDGDISECGQNSFGRVNKIEKMIAVSGSANGFEGILFPGDRRKEKALIVMPGSPQPLT